MQAFEVVFVHAGPEGPPEPGQSMPARFMAASREQARAMVEGMIGVEGERHRTVMVAVLMSGEGDDLEAERWVRGEGWTPSSPP